MTTHPRWQLIIAALLIVGMAGIGGGIYAFRRHHPGRQIVPPDDDQLARQIAAQIVGPRKTAGVQPQAWARLQAGMTRQQVIELLGEAPNWVNLGSPEIRTKEELERIEFWEYGYTHGAFATVPHPQAHVVYFNQDGTVSSCRAPTNTPAKGSGQIKP